MLCLSQRVILVSARGSSANPDPTAAGRLDEKKPLTRVYLHHHVNQHLETLHAMEVVKRVQAQVKRQATPLTKFVRIALHDCSWAAKHFKD